MKQIAFPTYASLVAQVVKRLPAMRETGLIPGFDPWVGKIPWRRKWQPTPVLLPGKFHGQRSLVGYSPWGRKESDTTERLHFTYASILQPKDIWPGPLFLSRLKDSFLPRPVGLPGTAAPPHPAFASQG